MRTILLRRIYLRNVSSTTHGQKSKAVVIAQYDSENYIIVGLE
jgi:hypothetical protein